MCDEDNFSQKISQLIEERSKVYAEFDGTIYEKVIDENDKLKKDYDKYYIIDGNIVSKDIQRQYINNGILGDLKLTTMITINFMKKTTNTIYK